MFPPTVHFPQGVLTNFVVTQLIQVLSSFLSNYWNSYCRCYIATASPAKFQAAVQRAGLTFDLPEAVLVLDKLATRYQNLERSPNWCRDWEDRLREKIQSVSSVRKNKGTYYSWLWKILLCKIEFYFRNPNWTFNCLWMRLGDYTATCPWSVHFLIWL